MRYVAAYLLAVLSGNQSPDLKSIEKILGSVGIETDKEKANKVISELNGKSIESLIAEGQTKLASVPSGGGTAASSSAPAAAAAKEEPKKEEKKEEKKKEEKKEESDDEGGDMGFGLFD